MVAVGWLGLRGLRPIILTERQVVDLKPSRPPGTGRVRQYAALFEQLAFVTLVEEVALIVAQLVRLVDN